jgi:hypothetical protein
MDSCAVLRKTRIRNITARTASSVNGVLIHDAASVWIRGDTNESPTINLDH